MEKHINIPIFIPHLGCPNMCVFCNQRLISGTSEFDESTVTPQIEAALSTAGGRRAEIAFFGGSFTGIDRALMIRLLDTAQRYVDSGKVSGIRMSTRPDYIDTERVEILKEYTVSQVELGIQSMSDEVLRVSKRGHTAHDVEQAVSLLVSAGFEVVGQMMAGLPASREEDEIMTAEKICDMGCAASRIYPTVVFKGTELEKMYLSGEYSPLTDSEAADRCSEVLEVFASRGIPCLRIGLCDSENLHSESTYSAGPNDPAIGEAAMSRLFYRKIAAELEKTGVDGDKTLYVECPRGSVSKIVGNRRENRERLLKQFGIKRLKTIEKDDLIGYNIKVLFK